MSQLIKGTSCGKTGRKAGRGISSRQTTRAIIKEALHPGKLSILP